MLIGPKYKICKRLGASVFEKCQTQKFQLAEAKSPRRVSRRGRGGGSDYGPQLLEKQKARFTYGLSEKQFSRYAHEAMEEKGANSASGLITRLETRLDNIVYRAGFAPTRRSARQLTAHGHITVNGRRTTIPSYQASEGDIIAVRPESRTSPFFARHEERRMNTKLPAWLSAEEGGLAVRVVSVPEIQASELAFDPTVIIQFYSR